MSEKRELCYRDRWVLYLVQELSDRFDSLSDFVELPFTDLTTRIPVTFNMNGSEYTKILSSVLNGSDLSFPEISHELYMIVANPEDSVTCEQIIECIENDAEVAIALQQWLSDNGYGSGEGTPDTPSVYDSNPLVIDGSSIPSCDNDNLFGAITGILDLSNNILTSVFTRFEVLTSYVERTALLISGIPGIGILPVDEITDFIDQIVSSVGENFDAQYTPGLRDEYRCDLFCLVKDTCEIDFQTISDYFFNRAGAVISSENLSDFLEWFVTGVFEGEQIADAAFGLLFSVFSYGTSFFDNDVSWFMLAVNAALNDPDSDWTILCDDCLPIYPELTTARCDSGQAFGSLTQESADTWLLEFENTDPFASLVTCSSVGFVPYVILSIEDITVGALKTATFFDEACTLVSGGWGDGIERANCNGYAFATNAPLASVRIVVAPIG